ncbi:MAG: nitrogen fixation protein FixK [Bradyrhizobiaceae bacterium PARB1]|jgi:CRP-like cAMP-binding protein|nr:MAG: nitrogen fixation protein FixK [Bradyrhizobiaceae bacterium PARB1]
MTQQMAAAPLAPCTTVTGPSTGFLSRLNFNDRRQLMALGERVPRGANDVLFAQGAPAARCFSVIEGVVCLSRGVGDNRRQIVGFALPGAALEIGAQQRHEVSAVAVGSALVWEIARESFAQFVSHRPYVLHAVIAAVAADLTDAHEQMFSLGRRPAEEKLASFLAEWRERLVRVGRDVEPLPLPMSRRDIADYLGLTVETVCRTLAKLERRGAIEILPGRVRLIVEPDELLRACG